MKKRNSLAAWILVGLVVTTIQVIAQSNDDSYAFTSLVTNVSNDNTGGTESADRFYCPFGVAVDRLGNVYVADAQNDTISKVTPAGVVTTLAGFVDGSGSADGTGIGARFSAPSGVAVDRMGNIYVADSGNCTIRKMTPDGRVTTLAGLAKQTGSVDGAGSIARFYYPQGIAVDDTDNIYVTEQLNHTIRKITPLGVVSTLAGLAPTNTCGSSADGMGSVARFNRPIGVAVDNVGNLYVADSENCTIRKVMQDGRVTTLAGLAKHSGSVDGMGNVARFNCPVGVAVDKAGSIYVGDAGNNTIRKVTPAGVVTTLAGFAGNLGNANGPGRTARFYAPSGVAVDSAGNVYVADSSNRMVRKVTPMGVVTKLAGLTNHSGSMYETGNAAGFNCLIGVLVNSESNVYVPAGGNHTIW